MKFTTLLETYDSVRRRTEILCEDLAIEDYVVQTMPDVSPPKWHLGHTTWFFETFILDSKRRADFDSRYQYLFNSYYEAVGPRVERAKRGTISRPTVAETYHYRKKVDAHIGELLVEAGADAPLDAMMLGLHHEEQHQELLLTDIKHILWNNPLKPGLKRVLGEPRGASVRELAQELKWVEVDGGAVQIGAESSPGTGFAFDNEKPRHTVHLQPFAMSSRLVTNGEYLKFIEDGGYDNAKWWLSDGLATSRLEGWRAPLYWEKHDSRWWTMTLEGPRAVDLDAPVTHVSYFEADAYARWRGARLPTEFEWEAFAVLHAPARELWQWTSSAYLPYPGFKAFAGAFAEYNGKFMCGQMVLRGGSWATPENHTRATYRNFFPPSARWQFSGIRLAIEARRSRATFIMDGE